LFFGATVKKEGQGFDKLSPNGFMIWAGTGRRKRFFRSVKFSPISE